jgi:hypothetical protein
MATAVESQTLSPDWTHILVETSSLDDIRGALRGSSRLKYTCIDVSSKFLVLGSNTGSVYVFGRSSQKHPQIIFPEIVSLFICLLNKNSNMTVWGQQSK